MADAEAATLESSQPTRAQLQRPTLNLSGPQKAAVLLVSLGAEKASAIFRHLKEQEVEALSLEMAKTRRVASATSAAIFSEVVDTIRAEDYIVEGGVDYAREVLEKSVGGDRATEIIGRLAATIERRPFEFLRRTPPEQIYMFLKNETAQTIAVVVANLHTTLAAHVLSEMPPEQQAEVALRIATMGETRPEVVGQLEAMIKEKLSSLVSQEYAAVSGVKPLAEILNHADRPTERNVLDQLSETEPELAEEIRRLLFTFEDLIKLDDRSIQLVLKDVDQKDLAIALRGVSDEVKQRVFDNMSERGASMLAEEMEFQPPQRRRVIEEAQGKIVAVVRRLEEAGALVISRGGEDDVV
ncbi:MAG: flagellar motor switch protein FliG [Solirubrobacteraceae bacterium]